MKPSQIPVHIFAPDLADHGNTYTSKLKNVILKQDGVSPLPAFVSIKSSAIPTDPVGAFSYIDSTGAYGIYVGTITKLYDYDKTNNQFDDVSRASAVDYGSILEYGWQFTQIEDINGNRVIATNGVDDNQFIDVDVGTNFEALPNMPKARYCTTVGDFLFVGALATDERKVAWSGVKDSTFYEPGFRGSDNQPLPDGGIIQNLVGLENACVVFQTDKIRIFERIAGSAAFSMRTLHENIGCFASNSVARFRNEFFWYDQTGFYRGIEAIPIGTQRVDDTIREIAAQSDLRNMRSFVDPINKIVWWYFYLADRSIYAFGYHWTLEKWSEAAFAGEFNFAAVTPPLTVDSLTSYTYDDAPAFPIDSLFWQGQVTKVIAGFDSDNNFGYYQGSPMEVVIETPFMEFNAGNYAFLNYLRVISDADPANITVEVITKRLHGGSETTITAPSIDAGSGKTFPRVRAQQHKIRVTISSHTWTYYKGLFAFVKGAGS